jgi:putative ABC transport system permease protein
VPLIVLCAVALERVRTTATADLGFECDLLYAVPLRFDAVAAERVASGLRSARANLEQASGVAAATVAEGLPLDFGSRGARVSLQMDSDTAPTVVTVQTTRVADRYLETMGIPLLIGRGFTRDDTAGGEMVTVISKTLAEQLAPGAPSAVLGRQLTLGTDEKTQHLLTIVGVTRDFPTAQMGTPRAQLLLPLAQHPSPNVFLIARSVEGAQPLTLIAALENAVRDLGPDVDRTITSGGTLHAGIVTGVQLRKDSVRNFLERSAITGGAGGVVLMLAALGIYGVVGLMVATRTREIAVRVAVGASRRRVLSMILVDVVKLVTPGVFMGLLLAVAVGRLPVNAGVKLSDAEPLAYVAGAAIVVLVAVLTSLTHARRAASVDPMVALRSI